VNQQGGRRGAGDDQREADRQPRPQAGPGGARLTRARRGTELGLEIIGQRAGAR